MSHDGSLICMDVNEALHILKATEGQDREQRTLAIIFLLSTRNDHYCSVLSLDPLFCISKEEEILIADHLERAHLGLGTLMHVNPKILFSDQKKFRNQIKTIFPFWSAYASIFPEILSHKYQIEDSILKEVATSSRGYYFGGFFRNASLLLPEQVGRVLHEIDFDCLKDIGALPYRETILRANSTLAPDRQIKNIGILSETEPRNLSHAHAIISCFGTDDCSVSDFDLLKTVSLILREDVSHVSHEIIEDMIKLAVESDLLPEHERELVLSWAKGNHEFLLEILADETTISPQDILTCEEDFKRAIFLLSASDINEELRQSLIGTGCILFPNLKNSVSTQKEGAE